MSPRKRARPNPEANRLPVATTNTTAAVTESNGMDTSSHMPTSSSSAEPTGHDEASSCHVPQHQPPPVRQVQKARSWYGSWPRAPRPKSSASTQVVRETILGGTMRPVKAPDLARFDVKKIAEDVSGDPAAIPKLPPVDEAETMGTSDAQVPAPSLDGSVVANSERSSSATVTVDDQESLLPVLQRPVITHEMPQRPATSSGWLGWLGRPVAPTAVPDVADLNINKPVNPESEPLLKTEPARDSSAKNYAQQTTPDNMLSPTPAPSHANPQLSSEPHISSWFGIWSNRPPPKENEHHTEDSDPGSSLPLLRPTSDPVTAQEDAIMHDAPSVTSPEAQPAGSTWAFWSRDSNNKSRGTVAGKREPGEIAVIGAGSEAHPEPASTVEVGSAPVKEAGQATAAKEASKKPKRVRPQSMDIDEPSGRPATPKSISSVRTESSSSKAAAPTPETPNKTPTANLLLPSFRSTYRMKENPSIIRQIAQLLLRTQQQPPANHVFLTNDPPKIKKALAIGVHGLFPATYLRPMIGQPTGTSIRFANHCADSIRRWADSHGCEDCEIEKVALEGEGKIAERVENLWKLLLNWIDHVRKADLIVVACHSQGVPVSIMLVAKLIELGIITTPRIGVCAMAGVSLGPFPSYQSGILMGSAAELWEFANPDSEVSKRYETSLKAVLEYGVRVTYIGSIDDQVVPLESALYSPARHPLLYRAVFVDARAHAPDFIAHLVGFALKLRNMGISDHGLIRELSVPLAGSLYSGAGHSTLYDDPQLYDLAVSHALETSDVGRVPCQIGKHEGIASTNPYHLPWIMRGLLEEDFVKTELSAEVTELLKQFDSWRPATKALKDVKYRLEAVRSKL